MTRAVCFIEMPDYALADFHDLDLRERSRAIGWHAAFAPVWVRILFPRSFEGTWSPTDMQVLIEVRRSKGATTGEIARGLALSRASVTAACQKLGDAKMLTGEHDPEGRSNRARRWRVTAQGSRLYKRWGDSALGRWEEYLDGVLPDSAYRE